MSFIDANQLELQFRIERACAAEETRYRHSKAEISQDWMSRGLSSCTAHWGALLTEGLNHLSIQTKMTLDELFAIAKAERARLSESDVAAIIDFVSTRFKEGAAELLRELSKMANDRGFARTWNSPMMQPSVDKALHLACAVEVPIRAAEHRRILKEEIRKQKTARRDKLVFAIVGAILAAIGGIVVFVVTH